MKAVFAFLVFTSSLMGFLNAEEDKCSEYSISEKTYIDPNQVHFIEDAIYVNIQRLWVQTTAVHVDSNGFYISSFRPVDESSFSWKCGKCGKYNEAFHNFCKKCGNPRS